MNNINIKDMVWSFSRLNSFYQCKYQWKMNYIDKVEGVQNAFSEYGSLVHEILEKYAKDELAIFELAEEYQTNYCQQVTHPFPPNKFVNLSDSYFNAGYEYLNNFEGFGKFEVEAVEKKIEFSIGDVKMIGFIDLLAKDADGNLHVIDHKSSDPKSAKSEKAREYFKQMYLYSIPIYEEYGIYPKQLHINAFRKQQWFTENFEVEKIDQVKQWVLDTVELIKKEENFLPKSNSFFCNFLCNYRNICEYKPQG